MNVEKNETLNSSEGFHSRALIMSCLCDSRTASYDKDKKGIRRYKFPVIGCILKPLKRTRNKCATQRRKVSRKRSGCRRKGKRRSRKRSRKCGKVKSRRGRSRRGRSRRGRSRRGRSRRGRSRCGKSRRGRSRRSRSLTHGCSKRRGRKGRCMREGPVTNNSYLNFLRCYRKSNCGLKPVEAVKRGAKVWCAMSEKRKQKYRKMACRASKSRRRRSTKFCRAAIKGKGKKRKRC